MIHVKSVNEFVTPRLPISKEELGMGIKPEDELIINSKPYYFWYFDEETNGIHVVDESGEEEIFNLDELNDTWEISKINDHEVVVESKSEDHEVGMAINSLNSIIEYANELKSKIGTTEKDLPAWIQDHISNAENYIQQACTNYHEY